MEVINNTICDRLKEIFNQDPEAFNIFNLERIEKYNSINKENIPNDKLLFFQHHKVRNSEFITVQHSFDLKKDQPIYSFRFVDPDPKNCEFID